MFQQKKHSAASLNFQVKKRTGKHKIQARVARQPSVSRFFFFGKKLVFFLAGLNPPPPGGVRVGSALRKALATTSQ